MRSFVMILSAPILILVMCLTVFAEGPAITFYTKQQMISEIQRGNKEVLNCISGSASDKVIIACVSSVLDVNITNQTDTAAFLVGAYFTGYANIVTSNSSDNSRSKWIVTYVRRFTEIQKDIGFSDKEICEITNNRGMLFY